MDAIVIRKRKYFNFSYASTKWNKWGDPSGIPIIICDNWADGFKQAQHQGYQLVLFIDSGTVFTDINEFSISLKRYPHRGLVGHIIDPKDNNFYSLHEQCFLMDISDLDHFIFDMGIFQSVPAARSTHNIHDDYTPLWLKPTLGDMTTQESNSFGQRIIAKFLNRGLSVSNWHNKLRDNKIYLYDSKKKDAWLNHQQDYITLAEQHLWILNNQKFDLPRHNRVICPASGIFWMLAAMSNKQIDIVDISSVQLKLAEALIQEWNGVDYGSFVYDFVRNQRLRHLQFDQANFTHKDKLELLSKKDQFVWYVNLRFESQMFRSGFAANEIHRHWTRINKDLIKLHKANIVDWITTDNIDDNTSLWISNILEYKYTWLKSDSDQVERFDSILKQSGAEILT